MKKRTTLLQVMMLAGIVVVGLIVGSRASAQGETENDHSCPMMQGTLGASASLSQHVLDAALHHAGHLGLSEEQITSLKTIRLTAAKDQVHSKAEIKVIELELTALFDQSDLDLKAVEAKLKEGEAHRTAAQLSHLRFQEQARKVLTAEQWQTLKTLHTGSAMPSTPEKEQHQHGEGDKGHSGMMQEMCGH